LSYERLKDIELGHLWDAKNMIKAIFYKLDVATWMALLDAWKIHG
jgi:hypothetical protein